MMTDKPMAGHADIEVLLSYFEEALTEERERSIEEHLALCDECAQLARHVHGFHRSWETWTARTHSEAELRAELSAALREVENRTSESPVRDRLRSWREHWAGVGEAALRVVLDSRDEASRIVTDGLRALTRPGARWEFSPVPLSAGVHGTAKSSSPEGPVVVALGDAPAQVAVQGGSHGEVTVRVEKLEPGTEPPLILLVSLQGKDHRVEELRRSSGGPYWIARFRSVPPGDYLVAFEPIEEE